MLTFFIRRASVAALACALAFLCAEGFTQVARAAASGAGSDTLSTRNALDFARGALADTSATADSLKAVQDSLKITKTAGQRMIDSLKALGEIQEGVSEVWRGPVKYATDYTLNRTTSNWNQSLAFEFSARGISVTTSTSGNVYGDTETKSDRRSGNADMTIDFAPSERLSVGLDVNTARYADKFFHTRYNTDDINARASYAWDLPEVLRAKVTATAGLVDETKPTYTAKGTTSALDLNTRYVFPVPCTLTVNATGRLGSKHSTDLEEKLETSDQDVNENVDATLGFIPHKSTSVRLGFNRTSKRLQYPFLGRQETWDSKGTVVDATFGVNVVGGLTLSTDAKYSDTEIDYAVEKTKGSSFLSKSSSTSLNGLNLLGTAVTSRFDIENSSNVTGSGRKGDTNTRTLSGMAERPLSSLITASVIANVSLAQYFFLDAASVGDERDVYKDGLSLGITFARPGSRYTGSATIKRDIQKMVYVRSKNSGNSRTNELYSASASFSYKVGKITFSQAATTTTDYTLFLFTESQNVLARTTSISSAINVPWGSASTFRLAHTYRVQDNGSYTTPEGAHEKIYQRSGGTVTEELYLTMLHKLSPSLGLSFGQRFQQSNTFRFVNDRKKWKIGAKVLEFLSDVRLTYMIDNLSTVNFSVTRTNSAFGQSYWNASAGVSRQFF